MRYSINSFAGAEQNDEGKWCISKIIPQPFRYVVEDTDEITSKDVCKFLKSEGIIESADQRKVTAIIGEELIIVQEKKSGKPICSLTLLHYVQ